MSDEFHEVSDELQDDSPSAAVIREAVELVVKASASENEILELPKKFEGNTVEREGESNVGNMSSIEEKSQCTMENIFKEHDSSESSFDEHESGSSDSSSSAETSETHWLYSLLNRSLKLRNALGKDGSATLQSETDGAETSVKRDPVVTPLDITGIAEYIKQGKCRKIVVMTGAGISTAAGIPDFRSPGSGLYDNLQRFNLPHPQAIFEISFFRENPQPFFVLAKELYPGQFKPTVSHYFIRLLEEKQMLLRNYTQNIDTLERIAGLSQEKIIEAHGTFHTGHCLDCQQIYTQEWMKGEIFANNVPTCPICNGIVKPDIVFFGEGLPEKFHQSVLQDFTECDLLVVMGTSLVVQPFASLVDRVNEECPRLLINKERSGESVSHPLLRLFGITGGFTFDETVNYRDIFLESTCDEGCLLLADLCGWGDELRELVKSEHDKIDGASKVKVEADESNNTLVQHTEGAESSAGNATPNKSSSL